MNTNIFCPLSIAPVECFRQMNFNQMSNFTIYYKNTVWHNIFDTYATLVIMQVCRVFISELITVLVKRFTCISKCTNNQMSLFGKIQNGSFDMDQLRKSCAVFVLWYNSLLLLLLWLDKPLYKPPTNLQSKRDSFMRGCRGGSPNH